MKDRNTIAAILLESVTGTNGIIIPPAGYLQGVRELCDKYQILLIADEVMSGFGRTGHVVCCRPLGCCSRFNDHGKRS